MKANTSESQFLADFNATDVNIVLDTEESVHAVKVFRHRNGDTLRLCNSKGLQALATLVDADPRQARLDVTEVLTTAAPPRLHLAIAALKDNDLEEVMDHCGQLALASLTILRTEHSQEPKDSDLKRTVRRLELKSRVACKQALKPWLTQVRGPIPLAQWLLDNTAHIVLCDIDGSPALPEAVIHPADDANLAEVVLAVGPEGGFTALEVATLKDCGAHLLSLGSTRLRAKTCPIVALGALLGMGF